MTLLIAMLFGCAPPPGQLPPPEWTVPDDGEVVGMYGFTWMDGRALATAPRPSDADLHWMGAEGIELLITLTETALPAESLDAAGLESLHFPIEDFQPPTWEQTLAFVDEMELRRDNGSPVAVHCLAGRGRSGTMAAIWLVHIGFSAEAAILEVRARRPGAIETEAQEQAVFDYALWRETGEEPLE